MTVIDVSEADFEAEVLNRSSEIPVVVDFWAPWCAPCRALGPSLEKSAAAREGKIVLAKIDTDENPGLAQQFGIQGIPAVKAFQNGEVVAEFVGGLPPAQVERFFDGLVPSEAQLLVDAGDEASLRKAVELDPKNVDAALALAQILYRAGDADGALALVEAIPGTSFRAAGLAARIELERDPSPEVVAALALLDGGELEPGLDALLALLAAKDAGSEQIRRIIVAILDELGVDHPLARQTRRKLAAALY